MSWAVTQSRLNDLGYHLSVDGIPGAKTYGALFAYMSAADKSPILGSSAATLFPHYGVTSPLRIAHWLAQFGVESGNFQHYEENLNYSAQRLCQVWPNRFPSLSAAEPYAFNPEALANKVYGGRMGNEGPDDGWAYRGRGPGLTGRDNYTACSSRIGLDLVDNPDLASKPENFVLIACDFWAQAGCNSAADNDDLRAVTLKINGGYTGIADRARLLTRAETVLQ